MPSPLGEHPNPHAEWITVRLDFIQEAIDHFDWLEKGISEWRSQYLRVSNQAKRLSATASVAVDHLNTVLNKSRTHAEQQAADTAARKG